MSGHESVTGAWLHSLLECMVYSWAWECNYKLNDQPVRERVTASLLFNVQRALVSFSTAVYFHCQYAFWFLLLFYCCPSVTNLWQCTISLGDLYKSQEEYTSNTLVQEPRPDLKIFYSPLSRQKFLTFISFPRVS